MMAAPGFFGSPGILGSAPLPLQAPAPGRTPWTGTWDQQSLANSFSTMALNPPAAVTDWVTDSGASNHTTPDIGNISLLHPPNSVYPSSIVVGNSSTLSVNSVGDSVLPGHSTSITSSLHLTSFKICCLFVSLLQIISVIWNLTLLACL